jgi:hypothetical protein
MADGRMDGVIDVIFLQTFVDGKWGRAPVRGGIAIAFLHELEDMNQLSRGIAHELGHTVGLCDVFEINLMMKISTPLRKAIRDAYLPSNLTREQIMVVQLKLLRRGMRNLNSRHQQP